MVPSCVRIDVRISAAANRVIDKHAVLLDPFIRNTENLNLYSPVVSSKIFSPQRFRRIDQRVDDTEMRFAFILVHPYPPYRSLLPLNVFFGIYGQYLYGVGERGGCSPPCSPLIHLSSVIVVFVQCCVSLTILSPPPRDSGPILYKFQGFATVRNMRLIFTFGRRGGNPTR